MTNTKNLWHGIVLLIVMAAIVSYNFSAMENTTITGAVTTPDNVRATSGVVRVTLSESGSAPDPNALGIVAGRATFDIDPNGNVTDFVLVPNDVITPAGTYYTVRFSVRTPVRTSWTQLWSVTTSPDPIAIGSVTRLDTPSVLIGNRVFEGSTLKATNPATAVYDPNQFAISGSGNTVNINIDPNFKGSPGGSDTQMLYNNAGVIGGAAQAIYDDTISDYTWTTPTPTIALGDADEGMLKFGTTYIGQADETISGTVFDDIAIFNNTAPVLAENISFMFMGPAGLPRFVLSAEGADLATYNPRSLVIGPAATMANVDENILCSTNFSSIDCDTAVTGADLGVEDDVEIGDDLFVGGQATAGEIVIGTDPNGLNSIWTNTAEALRLGANSIPRLIIQPNGTVRPATVGDLNLGLSTFPWTALYADTVAARGLLTLGNGVGTKAEISAGASNVLATCTPGNSGKIFFDGSDPNYPHWIICEDGVDFQLARPARVHITGSTSFGNRIGVDIGIGPNSRRLYNDTLPNGLTFTHLSYDVAVADTDPNHVASFAIYNENTGREFYCDGLALTPVGRHEFTADAASICFGASTVELNPGSYRFFFSSNSSTAKIEAWFINDICAWGAQTVSGLKEPPATYTWNGDCNVVSSAGWTFMLYDKTPDD